MLNIEACKTLIFATRHEGKSIFTRLKGPEYLPKTVKYDAKLMLKKVRKIDAKMAALPIKNHAYGYGPGSIIKLFVQHRYKRVESTEDITRGK